MLQVQQTPSPMMPSYGTLLDLDFDPIGTYPLVCIGMGSVGMASNQILELQRSILSNLRS